MMENLRGRADTRGQGEIKLLMPIIIFLVVCLGGLAMGVNSTVTFLVAAACAFGIFVLTIRL